jgi:hypothetical protein
MELNGGPPEDVCEAVVDPNPPNVGLVAESATN